MPVTAKLSRKFYEQLGDDIAGELVDWFNAVDATYQAQLKETNELLWERFKAALQGEAAAIRGEISGEIGSLRSDMRSEMSAMRADLLKWMFIYWCGSVIGIVGLLKFSP